MTSWTTYLSDSETASFVRKIHFFTLLGHLPYSYPWTLDTFCKWQFFLVNEAFFESENGCFVREMWRCVFLRFGRPFLRLYEDLWFVRRFGGSCWGWFESISGVEDCLMLVWGSPKPPRNLRSLFGRAIFTSLYCSLQTFDVFPPWGLGPTRPILIADGHQGGPWTPVRRKIAPKDDLNPSEVEEYLFIYWTFSLNDDPKPFRGGYSIAVRL